jgi:hypothetical protein
MVQTIPVLEQRALDAHARARESNSPDDHEAAAEAFEAVGMFITARLARNTAARIRAANARSSP